MPRVLLAIGLIEILIGGLTLLTMAFSLLLSLNTKAPNVLTFVLMTAILSLLLGIGILIHNEIAYKLLIYFSSVIILSKILIFADLLRLNGAFENFVPSPVKNVTSIAYHSFLIFYLTKSDIKNIFIKLKKVNL